MDVNNFFNTNHRVRKGFGGPYCEIEITDIVWKYEMAESEKSGLFPDLAHNIYVREGFGALVGWCPDNCSTLAQLLNYNPYHRLRKIPDKPTLLELIKEFRIRIADNTLFNNPPYYNTYKKKFEKDGMDLVIGPGGYVEGEYWEKAVYCRNYRELLGIEFKVKQKTL